MPKEKLTAREVKARLGKNTSKTPINLFDAEPYVHYQRQLYYAIVCWTKYKKKVFKNF